MNININKITGSVTVGNRNVVTHYNHSDGSRRRRQQNRRDSDSDSDSWSSSDSDSEEERQAFFARQGVTNMPTKKQFRELRKNMKQIEKQMPSSARRVHSVFVKQTGATSAFDSSGKPVPIHIQTMSSGLPLNQHWNASTFQTPVNQQPTTSRDQPTIHEQQTQKFEQIMRELQLPNRAIDERLIRKISPEFGRGWRRVFRHLNLSDADIDGTFQDCGEIQETVRRLLVKWARTASTPDVQTLVEALVRADQVHIVLLLHS